MATRARAPSWLGGNGALDRVLIEGQADDSISDPCHFKLMLENAVLKEKLKHCDPTPVPDPVTVPVEIKAAPLKVKVVPDEEPVGAVGFPAPARIAWGPG